MARFRGVTVLSGVDRPVEHQLTITDKLDDFARLAEVDDPRRPARALGLTVLALMAIGFLLQVGHAATTVPPEAFRGEVAHLLGFRLFGLGVLAMAMFIGPRGVERFIPLMTVAVIVMLAAVYVPAFNSDLNGSRRWIHVPFVGLTVQPSEIARVVIVLWVARRCIALGPMVTDGRRGYLPMLAFGLLLFGAILGEPDVGGSLLFLICFVCTMWVGGARPAHVAGSVLSVGGGGLLLGVSVLPYARERLAVWLGESSNEQVQQAAAAIASGDLFGVGLAQGGFRNSNLMYQQTDYALSLVGEELGFVGICVVLGLFFSFVWFSVRLVLSLRDRFSALVAFGLLISVAFQAMLHVQVVTGLAPPKGMNLPFISDGGSALIASCLAVGLAIGAAFRPTDGAESPRPLRVP